MSAENKQYTTGHILIDPKLALEFGIKKVKFLQCCEKIEVKATTPTEEIKWVEKGKKRDVLLHKETMRFLLTIVWKYITKPATIKIEDFSSKDGLVRKVEFVKFLKRLLLNLKSPELIPIVELRHYVFAIELINFLKVKVSNL